MIAFDETAVAKATSLPRLRAGCSGVPFKQWFHQRKAGIKASMNEEVRRVPVKGGYEAIVNLEDYEAVKQFIWFSKNDPRNKYARATPTKNGVQGHIYMHHLILPKKKGIVVDHINGNGLDNRRCNLRYATQAQNSSNSRPFQRSKSGFKGVSWATKRQRWFVSIAADRRRYFLGEFLDKVEGAKAYDKAARILHGVYAKLNFP
jgi:hypothetical protein